MKEQIYINGRLMQQDEGRMLSLIYQSPYFTDIDAIVSNRTTAVDFPRTTTNMNAIDLAGLPQGTSLFEYNVHRATYVRDGLQIFTGTATVLSITSTTIRMSFAWGNVEVFKQLLDAKLRDLQSDADEEYIPWNLRAVIARPDYYPAGWADPSAWTDAPDSTAFPVMPIVPVRKIMDRISERFGVSFVFPEGHDFNKYHLPITNRFADERVAERQGLVLNTSELTTAENSNGSAYRYVSGEISDLGNLGNDGVVSTSGHERLFVRVPAGLKLLRPMNSRSSAWVGVRICDIDDVARPIATVPTVISSPTFVGSDTTPYTSYTVAQDYEIEIDATQYRAIAIVVGLNNRGAEGLDEIQTITPRPITIYSPSAEYAEWGGDTTMLPLYRNLPDWTVTDFIKNLMKIEGLFAYATSANVITFLSLDDVYANRARAMDWSKRVMSEGNTPAEMMATFNNLAQKNWMRYAEDDTITGNFDGYIPVQSNVLEAENDLVNLDFAPTQGGHIPVWTADDKAEGGYEWQDVEPRILVEQPDGTLAFTGLSWDALISTKYATYAQTVAVPRTVKTSVYLDALDLVKYDPSVPVYVRQWGHYYAIIKLTTKDNVKADAELLQLGRAVQ